MANAQTVIRATAIINSPAVSSVIFASFVDKIGSRPECDGGHKQADERDRPAFYKWRNDRYTEDDFGNIIEIFSCLFQRKPQVNPILKSRRSLR